MSVQTYVHYGVECVEREVERTEAKRRQLRRFDEAVADLEPIRPASPTSGGAGWTASVAAGGAEGASVGAVLEAFEEHCSEALGEASGGAGAGDDASGGDASGGDAARETAGCDAPAPDTDAVHEAVAEELSRDLATALCGGDTAGALTPALKRAVRQATGERVTELEATAAALSRERASLEAAREPVDDLIDWFVEHGREPLSEAGFEQLRAWHDRLGEARERLDAAAADRQAHLRATTSVDGAVGIQHDVLVRYCYEDLEPTYPVLDTFANLASACRSARRALRDHLVRRV